MYKAIMYNKKTYEFIRVEEFAEKAYADLCAATWEKWYPEYGTTVTEGKES